MALPKAIQRQADAAAAAEQSLQAAATEPQPLVENVAQLLTAQPAESANQPPVSPAPPPAPAENWEQKYRSLQGLFAKETAELRTQLKLQESQAAALQQQVAALAAQKATEPKHEKPSADPKDVESFGADMIDMVQRYAEQVFQRLAGQFGQKVSEFESRIAAVEKQVTGVSQKTDSTLEQQFLATLNGLIPDWEQVNADPRWLQWLAETDPVYGAPRQAALDAASQRMDAQRVAAVFKAFKASLPAGNQDSLANQVAPSSVSSAAPVANNAKPILSAKSVEKFYRDVAQGRYAGREAEAAKLEAEIDLAARENRIR